MALPEYTYSGVAYATPAPGTTTFNLTTSPGGDPIGYLERGHIKVFTTIDDGDTLVELSRPSQWDFNAEGTQVVLVTPADGSTSYIIRRETPLSAAFVTFQPGRLTNQQLNDSALFGLYITQEVLDREAGVQAINIDALQAQVAAIQADNWVTQARMADNSVGTDELIDDSVTGAKIAANAVGSGEIAPGAVGATQLADDSVTAAKLGPASVDDAAIGDNVLTPRVSSINDGPLGGFRNYLINGDFRVWQRGSSFVSPGNDTYTADRWVYLRGGDARHTVFLDAADTPNDNFLISAHLDCTTADASISSTDRTSFEQYIEGRSILGLIGNTFTVSFWVKATKTGIYCFSLGNSGDDRSYVVEYTVNAANTWEFKSITITGGLITAGTWDYDTGVGLRVRWALAAGANFQTTAGAWQTGNFLATSSQVNATDSTANEWRITGVQLEVGTQATPFEFRPIGLERSLCKRYFRELWGGSGNNTVGPAQVVSTEQARVPYVLNPEMRADPTVSGAANCFEITVGGTDVFASIVGFSDSSRLSGHLNCSMSSSFTTGDAGVAKARSSITFDAEL